MIAMTWKLMPATRGMYSHVHFVMCAISPFASVVHMWFGILLTLYIEKWAIVLFYFT